MQLAELLDASTTARICADGCLVADVRAARVGIQQYLGREVDPENAHGLRDSAVVNVYRPDTEVFSRDSMASFAAAPVTIDHPTVAVDASNWRQLGVGEINGDVVRDREFVRVPIIVRDAAAVAKVNSTHKQLSMGYSCTLDFTPGELADGTKYDAVQRNIRINHIAAVPAARGGPELKISDERPHPQEKQVKKIVLDGLQVDLSDADAVSAAISKLQDKAATAETQVATLTTTIATKDAEIATLTQQAKDAAMTPAKLRDAAKAYVAIVDKAKALGLTVAEDADSDAIMKAAVAAKMGDAAKDWTADQIAASFAVLTKDAPVVDNRAAFKGGIISTVNDNASVRDLARAAQY